MEIKGTAVKSISDFIKSRFTNRYSEWLNSLPENSKKIMMGAIYAPEWYSLTDAAIIPTSKIGELFYQGDIKKGAWECGRFSAESALTGIYKLYVKMASPGHIIERAGRIFAAYYQPSEMVSENLQKNSVQVVIKKFQQPNVLVEYRIAGWIERALEISGCKSIKVEIIKSLTKNDSQTIFNVTWVL